MKSLQGIKRDNDQADRVKAGRLVRAHGSRLIGQKIDTLPMGMYPGGVATVTEIEPDPEAPEIVFQVDHPTFGSIGVFDYELVRLT